MRAVDLFDLGYKDLVSVIPPGANLSPASKIKPEARGKSPGIKYYSGLWGGYDWIRAVTTREHAENMDKDGANVGLRAGAFPAIDIDVRDERLADCIAATVERFLPTGPLRVGSWPKRLYVFRLPEGEQPFSRLQLFIEHGERHLVEILGDGQQYVISGVHPKTGMRYEWRKRLVAPAELPTLSLAQAEALLLHITEEVCDLAGLTSERSGTGRVALRKDINQESLRATDMDALAEAVAMIPNTNDTFPTREDYIRFGYALKGATQGDPGRGLQMFQEWAARWEGNENGVNRPEVVEADWDRMRAPFELGVDYIYDIARQWGFDSARYEFPAEPAPPPQQEREEGPQARHSDAWLMNAFVARYGGHLRYAPKMDTWLVWDGTYWRPDEGRAMVERMSVRTLTDMANQLMRAGATAQEIRANASLARALCSRRTIDATQKGASRDYRLVVTPAQLDSDPML